MWIWGWMAQNNWVLRDYRALHNVDWLHSSCWSSTIYFSLSLVNRWVRSSLLVRKCSKERYVSMQVSIHILHMYRVFVAKWSWGDAALRLEDLEFISKDIQLQVSLKSVYCTQFLHLSNGEHTYLLWNDWFVNCFFKLPFPKSLNSRSGACLLLFLCRFCVILKYEIIWKNIFYLFQGNYCKGNVKFSSCKLFWFCLLENMLVSCYCQPHKCLRRLSLILNPCFSSNTFLFNSH